MADERNFTQKKLPPEIVEIHEAQESVKDVLWWETRLKITAFVAYMLFAAIWIFQENDRALIGLLLAAAIWLYASTVLSHKVRSRRRITWNLICAYKRKKAVPLYHDMLEKFADQPHLHIHLDDDGTIQITDRREQ